MSARPGARKWDHPRARRPQRQRAVPGAALLDGV